MRTTRNPLDRFKQKVFICLDTGCWLWNGAKDKKGYGLFVIGVGNRVGAHRYIYEATHGPIPDGMVIDHFKCDNKSCVNPDHLRPVSHRENILRGDSPSSLNASKMVCSKCGGSYTDYGDHRVCKPCKRRSNKLHRESHKNPKQSEAQCHQQKTR